MTCAFTRFVVVVIFAVIGFVASSGNSFAQSDDAALKRLEAKLDVLARENAALRDRVRRLEGAKTSPRVAPTAPVSIASRETKAQASAEIESVRSLPNWTGLYVGGNVGFGWGEPTNATSNNNTSSGFGTPVFVPLNPAQYATKNSGWSAGVLTGYNHQINRSVLGVEADFNWANINGASDNAAICAGYAGGVPSCTYSQSQKLDWFGTVRGRLGFVIVPETMIYGTGGLALGHVKVSQSLFNTGFVGTFTAADTTSATKTGWVIGAGIESRISRNWMFRLEYLHYDLGTVVSIAPIIGPGGPSSAQSNFRVNGDLGRAGLIYKLD